MFVYQSISKVRLQFDILKLHFGRYTSVIPTKHKFASLSLLSLFSQLYQGILSAAEEIARLDPDLVLLHTPHGLCLSDSMTIYGNVSASGSAEWNGHWADFQVCILIKKI